MFSALHECGHVSNWRHESSAPKPGEALICAYPECGAHTKVVELFGPWRSECLDCKRCTHHGTFRKTLIDCATMHTQTWTTHRVWVWQYGDKDSRTLVTSERTGVQAELVSDAPF